MVSDRRTGENPIAHLCMETVTDEAEAGAFEAVELRAIIRAARGGAIRESMPGPERAALYELAAQTGLRSSELRSLLWSSLILDGESPTVTVRAAYAKNRRADTLPLKMSTAAMLARLRAQGCTDPNTALFPNMPSRHRVARMLRADMAASGVDEYNASGRKRNFHSLHHSFISGLAGAGISPELATDLARHSDINLTLRRYSHTVLSDRATAVAALPDLGDPPPVSARTGTDDAETCCTDVARASNNDWRTVGTDGQRGEFVGHIAE